MNRICTTLGALFFLFPTLGASLSAHPERPTAPRDAVKSSATTLNTALRLAQLRVEGRTQPLGLDVTTPRLSWQIVSTDPQLRNVHQTGFRILVASDPDTLRHDRGDLWDSGAVSSDQSQWVDYAGKTLVPNQRCYWKVRLLTNHGATAWSEPATWSVGLLGEDHWRGQWIGCDHAFAWDDETQHSRLSARYFRKVFNLKKTVRRATLHIAGLGLYEAYLNGQRVGDRLLTPAPTDYRRSIIYDTYDVTDLLPEHTESACLAVTLGNGRFYTMRQHYKPYKITQFGYPKLRANLILEYTDGSRETIVTDTSWKFTAGGPIRSNNEYDGETYDATREVLMADWMLPGYVDDYWIDAERVSLPDGTLTGNLTPGMEVVEQLLPQQLTLLAPQSDDDFRQRTARCIVDFGQNFAGRLRLNVADKGRAGDTIRIRFAERLTDNGELYTENLRSAEATDYYVCNGHDSGTWAPRFVTHGFRYAEVCNYPNPQASDFIGEAISDPMRRLGTFACADTMLNAIVRNAAWGILSNYKGMPVDCPQRDERMPWLGDRATGCWGESFLWDNATLYAKWLYDIEQAQRADGVIPDVAPAYWNYYSDNVSWPSVFLFAAEMLYQQYGDFRPIERHYPAMKRWLSHFENEKRNRDGLITADKYGDWCVPPESAELIHSQDPARQTDGILIASAYYYKLALLLADFADRLAATDSEGLNAATYRADAAHWRASAQSLCESFNRKFLHIQRGTSPAPRHLLYPDSTYYGNNSVTSNLLPLAFGMVPAEHRENIGRQILHQLLLQPNDGHLACGVIGIQWLMRTLSDIGRTDVAYLLATQESYPSWGYMVKQGATTIWELWNGDTASPKMNSGNHVMLLGDLLPWCFGTIGGIQPLEAGYRSFRLAPDFALSELPWAEVRYESPYGGISSRWQRSSSAIDWEFEIPCNTTAEIVLPAQARLSEVSGLPERLKKVKKGRPVPPVRLGSGHYKLHIPLDPSLSARAEINTAADSLRNDRVGIEADEYLFTDAPFPSCHAASLAELENGDLLCTFFGGTREAHPDVCIWTCRKRRLSDGTWEEGWSVPEVVQDGLLSDEPHIAAYVPCDAHDSLRKACYNPVLYQVPGGDLLLFFKIGRNVRDWTGYLLRSKDNGHTWSQRERLQPETALGDALPADSLLGAIKNKPEALGGRLIAPSSKEAGGWRCYMELSDDGGAHWRLTAPIAQEAGISAIQPTLLRHKDGRLQMLCRTRNDHVGTAWSSDGGETWSPLSLIEGLPNNNSGLDAVTLPNGTHVLVYNDFASVAGPDKPRRTPLCVATSRDGLHWRHAVTLEDSPIGQYSYPCVIVDRDGMLHIAYTWRRERMKYVRLKL